MIRAQLLIRLPEGLWLTDVSQTFPDATFTLLAGYSADETAIELGEIRADEPDAPVDALRTHPAITQFVLLDSADGRALSKYETTDTDLYEFVELSSLPVEFPVVARNGWFEFDLTGTRAELEQLRTTLEAADASYELQSVVSTTDTGALLTDRSENSSRLRCGKATSKSRGSVRSRSSPRRSRSTRRRRARRSAGASRRWSSGF